MMLSYLFANVLLMFGALHTGESGVMRKSERSGDMSAYERFKDHFQQQSETTDSRSLSFTRETYLYSRAAEGYVQIIGRKVNAKGDKKSPYARFLVESDNFGRVRFKGIFTGKYLCMNKNGKLIPRAIRRRKGKSKKSRKSRRDRNKKSFSKSRLMRRCVFKEVYEQYAYISYKLATNESWYLAFDKHGRPQTGKQANDNMKSPNDKMKSAYFIERPIGVKRNEYDDYQISERSWPSRPKYNRRKHKRSKYATTYQKSERTWPLPPDNNIINVAIIDKYLGQFRSRKKGLKIALKELIKLKQKVRASNAETRSKKRTRKLSTYSAELKRIIEQLSQSSN